MLSEGEVRTAHHQAEQAEGWGVLRVDTSRSDGGSLVVRLEGDLDIYNTRDLSNRLRQIHLAAADLVIDLSRLTFIDCAGLHLLVEARQRAVSQGRRVRLVKGPERVHRAFRLTGLESGFDFVSEPD
ncbi:MAG: STAS domain-containing protein [Actinomycetota bacterium]